MSAPSPLQGAPRRRVAALIALALAGCAEGKEPPQPTAMAEVRAGLTFQFGLGQQGCLVPDEAECSDAASGKSRLGMPPLQVTLAPFAIDVHEVTNEQYLYCVEMGVCSAPEGDETSNIREYWAKLASGGGTVPNPDYFDYPVVYVSWLQAKEYCAFVDKRLPSEFEWERVAGGPAAGAADKRVYPFGPLGPREALDKCIDKDINLYACTKLDRPRAAGGSAGDLVQEGEAQIFDLFGNVYEWTASDGDERVTCDAAQPYDCEPCVACLNSGKPRSSCKPQCFGCQCGDGPTETKPSCYLPCETPICPMVPASSQPVAQPTPAAWSTPQRVVRGGAFFLGSGEAGTAPCEGRSDERGFLWPATKAHIALGFRCARGL
jgi:formylglycine-generating enzyme required for sulfatase activity